MSVEERDRHEALVEKCCAETPKGESYRALFSNAPTKVLAEHLYGTYGRLALPLQARIQLASTPTAHGAEENRLRT